MDELDYLHDYLMDAYQYMRMDKPLMARLALGSAAAQISAYKDELEAIRDLYNAIHAMREGIQFYWYSERYSLMDTLCREMHEVCQWRNCKKVA